MIYLAGFVGFIGGFALGQMLLLLWLRGYSRRELLTNKELRYRYGVFNWLLAGVGAYVAVMLYRLVMLDG